MACTPNSSTSSLGREGEDLIQRWQNSVALHKLYRKQHLNCVYYSFVLSAHQMLGKNQQPYYFCIVVVLMLVNEG